MLVLNPQIKVIKTQTHPDLELVFKIRRIVFVEEQQVPAELEYDENDAIVPHFLAFYNHKPCGTARWRFTENGIKLERFAVLKENRSLGVGHELVKTVLSDILAHPDFKGQKRYLHSQTTAMGLYAKAGFKPVGELFYEAGIPHFKMELEG